MKNNLNFFFKDKNLGSFLFKIGIFFLPSALPIASIFLLLTLCISFINNYKCFFVDKLNYLLLTFSGLFFVSNLFSSIEVINNKYNSNNIAFGDKISIANIWVDLFNWIPLFLFFWGFKYFLNSPEKRKSCAKFIIMGTFPVIISCLAEYWFDFNEPLYGLNGLIVWYQQDYPEGSKVMSGLFSNPNYTAYWMSVVWPLSYALFLEKKSFDLNKLITFSFSLTIFYIALMTNSRNALIGILLSSFLLIGIKLIYFILILTFLIGIIYILSISVFPFNFEKFISELIPSKLIFKLTRFDFASMLDYQRIELYRISILNILKRPIFGWGAGTFALIYFYSGGKYTLNHTHNLFLELAYNYGLPLAFLLTSFIAFLFIRLFKKQNKFQFKKECNINRAWICACLVSVLFLMNDIPYYDGKLNIIFWILLSGLRCIGDEKNIKSTIIKN